MHQSEKQETTMQVQRSSRKSRRKQELIDTHHLFHLGIRAFLVVLTKTLIFLITDLMYLMQDLRETATIQNLVVYSTRRLMIGFLKITDYSMETCNKNPVMKVVEKKVKDIPNSAIMKSDQIDSTSVYIREYKISVKIIVMSMGSIMLTWVIKAATTARRSLINTMPSVNGPK